jgi:hypothetical protein
MEVMAASDFEILMAVQTVKGLYKRALTRAETERKRAIDHAFKHFGPTDVEQAARSNAVRRAERAYGEAVDKAAVNLRTRLADIRARAGQWSDLVPDPAGITRPSIS